MAQNIAVIAVDWGSTNRRIYRLGPDGNLVSSWIDDKGITTIPRGGFEAEIESLRAGHEDARVILGGMIGSNRGWIEAPYLPCPVNMDMLKSGLIATEDSRVSIVPGVCFLARDDADVMRGEEIQLLGAIAAGLLPGDAWICHPGTHAKWVELRAGAIRRFQTVMTGEMFALLRHHGLLATLLDNDVRIGPSFRAGLHRAFDRNDLLAALFSIRASVLLGRLEEQEAASYASGLMIGSDIMIGIAHRPAEMSPILLGDPTLTTLYATGLEEAGYGCIEINGEQAFLSGIRMIADLPLTA